MSGSGKVRVARVSVIRVRVVKVRVAENEFGKGIAFFTTGVRAIANRLIPQTVAFRPDAPQWKWEVNVIESDQLNLTTSIRPS